MDSCELILCGRMFRMEVLLSGLLQADTVGKDNIILLLAFSQKAFQYPKGAKLLGNSEWFPILRKFTDPHYSWAPHLRVHLFMQICHPKINTVLPMLSVDVSRGREIRVLGAPSWAGHGGALPSGSAATLRTGSYTWHT